MSATLIQESITKKQPKGSLTSILRCKQPKNDKAINGRNYATENNNRNNIPDQ